MLFTAATELGSQNRPPRLCSGTIYWLLLQAPIVGGDNGTPVPDLAPGPADVSSDQAVEGRRRLAQVIIAMKF